MLTYPQMNPVAFSIGPLHVHWYGLMYLLGFLFAYGLAAYRVKHYKLKWTKEQVSDLIFYSALGVILGGRIGYMLFYNIAELVQNPISLFKVWEGGMSFHGGFIGVVLACWFFSYKSKKSLLEIGDFAAPLAPLGFAFGRLGNFINGELWGRATTMSWGMVFPKADMEPRHPSQLYEFGLEGLLLFILVWWYASKPRATGQISAVFLIGYAVARMIAECFREPDLQLGFVAFQWVTMGQLLSIPMLIVGLIILWVKRHENVS